MDLPVYQGFVHLFQGRFFSKWKRFKAAVFECNRSGRARLELYSSDSQLSSLKPAKTVLLSECIAIRIVNFEKQRVIQVQQRNAPVLLIAADDLEKWQHILCKAAFPAQFVSIGAQPCSSLSTDSDNDIFHETSQESYHIPVLLLRSNDTRRLLIPAGNYELCFADSILLNNGFNCVQAWNYSQITWFGTGESCFAIEIDGERRFEFKCSRPWSVLDALREHLKLKADTRLPANTKNDYCAYYTPFARLPQTEDLVERYTPAANVQQRVSLFRGASRDQWHPREREDFETNADSEWIRYRRGNLDIGRTGRDGPNNAADISNALKFKEQLELTIASKREMNANGSLEIGAGGDEPKKIVRPRVLDDRLELSSAMQLSGERDIVERTVGGLPARQRESVASEASAHPHASHCSSRFRQSFID